MKKYKIKNWSEYNKSLIERGSITLWFNEETVSKWYNKSHTGAKGRPQIYSDDAILCALLIRTYYNKPLRALVGFLLSIVSLLKLSLKVPSYTQICRRAQELHKALKKLSNKRPKDIVFDSTGLKVYGEGEWKVRKHGASKRRTWRKLHIGLDLDSQEIIVAELTTNDQIDSKVGAELLKKSPQSIEIVSGDGAYDDGTFRKQVESIGAKSIIPPDKNAAFHNASGGYLKERDDAVAEIYALGNDDQARKIWKKLVGYHLRSLVETAMYRLKQLTGSKLKSRILSSQQTEALIKCLIVNKLTRLGMPKGEWIEIIQAA